MNPALNVFTGTKAIPRSALFRLGVIRIFWLFYTQTLTRAGRWFIWPSLTFLMYGSISLDWQAFVPFSYALGLWAVALFCSRWYRPRLSAEIRHAERVCAGERLRVDVELTQQGRPAPLTVVPHRLPEEIDCVPLWGLRLEGLARGQSHRVRFALHCRQRGVFVLHGVRLECDYPFGLLRSRQRAGAQRQLLVYPAFQRMARLDLPAGRRYQPGGVALASQTGDSFEYTGNREYRTGDDIRGIDWRATARLGRPVLREYREEYFLRVAVILDTFVQPGTTVLNATRSKLR